MDCLSSASDGGGDSGAQFGRYRMDPDLHGVGSVHDGPGTCAFLRRFGSNQERAFRVGAMLCRDLSGFCPLDAGWLQSGIHGE